MSKIRIARVWHGTGTVLVHSYRSTEHKCWEELWDNGATRSTSERLFQVSILCSDLGDPGNFDWGRSSITILEYGYRTVTVGYWGIATAE